MEPQTPLTNPEPTSAPNPSGGSVGAGLPDPAGMNLGGPSKKNNKNKLFIIIWAVVALLLVLVIVFAIVAASNSANQKKAESENQYQAGYEAGTKDQKDASEKEYIEKTGKDFRIYKAAADFGSFELPVPKTWSLLVNPKPADGAINGVADPDYIDQTAKYHVFSFDQKRADYDKVIKDMEDQVKDSRGAIVSSDVVVSGISGKRFKGVYDAKNNVKAEIVVIPLREKTITFRTDYPDKYSEVFNNILNNVKLNP